jgi:uncharacterized protein YecE (DUF72 family)
MVRTGTSGFNYPEWKGSFYPADLPASKMLPYYARRFDTVEINYTFYRMPTRKLVEGWASQVPDGFTFSLKAPRRITHDRRLRDCGDLVRGFCEVAAALGQRLAPLLFQLGPSFRCDVGLFDAFLDDLPPGARSAFEFRHASWLTDAIFDRLAARNLALCIADSEERKTPMVATADYGYVRLRDEGYDETQIRRWAAQVRDVPRWRDAYVYFKHEEEGKGPEFAQVFVRALQERA